jgi:hypothetical protein
MVNIDISRYEESETWATITNQYRAGGRSGNGAGVECVCRKGGSVSEC